MGKATKGRYRPERTSDQLAAQARVAMDFLQRTGGLLEGWRRDSALVGMMVHMGCSAAALRDAGAMVPLHLIERERSLQA